MAYDDKLREQFATIGHRIRHSREEAGLSQEQLADRAGLHRTYVGSVERGERNLSVANIYAIAHALGVKPGVLLDDPDRSTHTST